MLIAHGRDDDVVPFPLGRSVARLLERQGHTVTFVARDTGHDPTRARAPVAGIVAQVLVQPGAVVVAGQPLLSVEAMKMEMWLHAGAAGTVREVHAQPKASVAAGELLVELELSDMEPAR